MREQIIVLIADKSKQVLERLESLIADENTAAIIHTATNFNTAFLLFKTEKPWVVVLGMDLWNNKTMKLVKAMRCADQNTIIIILATQISHTAVEQFKLYGASIFLDKFFEFEKIPGIVKTIGVSKKSGNKFLHP